MERDAVAALGQWAGLMHSQVDPCAMEYLVGNGLQRGRAGYCSDEVGQENGPRLVVVPGSDGMGRFAISKYEVSWREFSRYCADTGCCEEGSDSDLPITNIKLDETLSYAAWLSTKTGHQYCLPNISEWTHVAQGVPDPNRNCRVDAVGVTRGHSPVAANADRSKMKNWKLN